MTDTAGAPCACTPATDVDRYTALLDKATRGLPGGPGGHTRTVVSTLLQILAAEERLVSGRFRVLEEWAVLSEDGEVYGVRDDSYEQATAELVALRCGDPADPERPGEPAARLVHRFRLVHRDTGRFRVTTWMHIPTVGDPLPSSGGPLPAFLRSGEPC